MSAMKVQERSRGAGGCGVGYVSSGVRKHLSCLQAVRRNTDDVLSVAIVAVCRQSLPVLRSVACRVLRMPGK